MRRIPISVADLVCMRGQADAAIETFEHLEHYLFDSGREVSAVRKRFRTHVETNWNSEFPRLVGRLRRAGVEGEAPTLDPLVAAAEDLVACHDLLDGLENYARPGSLVAVCFGALVEGESAARRLSQLVGEVVEQLATRKVDVMVYPTIDEIPPNSGRTIWREVGRVPSRIWRMAAGRAHQDWPQLFTTPLEQDPAGANELIPSEILDLREAEAATPMVQVSIRGVTLIVTRLHVALLEQLFADAVRQRTESSTVRLDLSAVAERLLVRSEPVRSALGTLLDAGLAEPFRASRISESDGACRITASGQQALAAARLAPLTDASSGISIVEIGADEPLW